MESNPDREPCGTDRTGVVVASEASRADALAVRHAVFVDEQGVPADLEVDEHDEAAATIHFVAYDEGTPVGAARLRPLEESTAKVERVAVLRDRRGEGWGHRLMDALEAEADARGIETLTMHAQTSAVGFYRDRGYATVGAEFEEAGIPHVEMERSV